MQPNALRKADFNGTWYYNATVIDAPPTNGNIYTGQYGELQKVKWVVSEDTLFAVRSYPFIYNQEDPKTGVHTNVDGNPDYEGSPLAAFRIQSHFDIIRDYNPTTGEETNRIIESTERPWYEREFFRVDWSQNIAPDFSGIGLDFTFGGVELTSLSYYVSDPNSVDAIHLERANSGDADLGFAVGEMNYLDITNQMIAQPSEQEFVIDEAGNTEKLPSCFAFYGTEDCAAQKFKLRHSFAKKAPNTTYEKRQWDGIDQQNFGFFTTALLHNWNRQYGDVYTGDKRYMERFNLFKKSCNTPGTTCEAPHRVRDPFDATWLTKFTDKDLFDFYSAHNLPNTLDGNAQPTGRRISEAEASAAVAADGSTLLKTTDDQGNPVAVPADTYYLEGTDGVPADQDTNWVKYEDREQHTIPYYPNEEMIADIWPVSQEVIRQWNEIFKKAVADVQHKDISQVQNVFVWCHNPVQAGDDAACLEHLKPDTNADGTDKLDANGKQIFRVRHGDPRYSSIIWINEEQAGGPLGLGPALADPETGETLSSKANIYGGAIDTYAAYARDTLRLMNGEVSTNQFIQGLNVATWVDQHPNGVTSQLAHPVGYTDQDTASNFGAMDFSWARGVPVGPSQAKNKHEQSLELLAQPQKMLQQGLFGPPTSGSQQTQLDRLRNSPLENKLMVPELVYAMGGKSEDTFAGMTPDQKNRFSGLNIDRLFQSQEALRRQMEGYGWDFEPFNYNVYGNDAKTYKGQDPQVVWRTLRDRIYLAVTLHEVGHNMGLRHNFRGSYDSMNYFPQYWKMRADAARADHPNDKNSLGQINLYPRGYTAPNGSHGDYSTAEIEGGSLNLQYSSIMDYGAAWDTDLAGLGHYDAAAIKYGYANFVEVFTNANSDTSTVEGQAALDKIGVLQDFKDAYGYPSALNGNPSFPGATAINYWTYNQLVAGDESDLDKRKDVSVYDIGLRTFRVNGTRPGTFSTSTVQASLENGKMLPMVPYFFCSDEFVGNLTCQRFDFGADVYEQANDIITRYKEYYVLRNFKRDAYAFHSSGKYLDYTYGRYFGILQEQLTWLALLGSEFTDGANQFSNPLIGGNPSSVTSFMSNSVNGWGSFTNAVTQSFNLFGQVLTAPQAGAFITSDASGGKRFYTQFNDTPDLQDAASTDLDGAIKNVDITVGRYETTSWNFTGCGYFWGDECQTRIGYFGDKYLVLKTLSESQAYFTGRDTSVDVRKYAIGYWSIYKTQILNMFGALMAGEQESLAPALDPNTGNLINQDFLFGSQTVPTTGEVDLIDPEIGFSLQLWAGVFGLSGFSSTFDHAFIDNTRVFLVGNGEAPVPDSMLIQADGTAGPLATFDPTQIKAACNSTAAACQSTKKEWLVFKDYLSGKYYAAHSNTRLGLKRGADPTNYVRQDIGARMLEKAVSLFTIIDAPNQLPPTATQAQKNAANAAAAAAAPTYLKWQENLDSMRAMQGAFGYGPYQADAQ